MSICFQCAFAAEHSELSFNINCCHFFSNIFHLTIKSKFLLFNLIAKIIIFATY